MRLKAGELLFVPQGTPHSVVNSAPSLALSANFLLRDNVDDMARELEVTASYDERAARLREEQAREYERLAAGVAEMEKGAGCRFSACLSATIKMHFSAATMRRMGQMNKFGHCWIRCW